MGRDPSAPGPSEASLAPRVRLWVDECLSPTLVGVCQERGYWATCNRDRGMLGRKDPELYSEVVAEDAILVTNNESDFIALCEEAQLHPGLIVMPQSPRDRQARDLRAILDYLEARSTAEEQPPRSFMFNRVVEMEEDCTIGDFPLP